MVSTNQNYWRGYLSGYVIASLIANICVDHGGLLQNFKLKLLSRDTERKEVDPQKKGGKSLRKSFGSLDISADRRKLGGGGFAAVVKSPSTRTSRFLDTQIPNTPVPQQPTNRQIFFSPMMNAPVSSSSSGGPPQSACSNPVSVVQPQVQASVSDLDVRGYTPFGIFTQFLEDSSDTIDNLCDNMKSLMYEVYGVYLRGHEIFHTTTVIQCFPDPYDAMKAKQAIVAVVQVPTRLLNTIHVREVNAVVDNYNLRGQRKQEARLQFLEVSIKRLEQDFKCESCGGLMIEFDLSDYGRGKSVTCIKTCCERATNFGNMQIKGEVVIDAEHDNLDLDLYSLAFKKDCPNGLEFDHNTKTMFMEGSMPHRAPLWVANGDFNQTICMVDYQMSTYVKEHYWRDRIKDALIHVKGPLLLTRMTKRTSMEQWKTLLKQSLPHAVAKNKDRMIVFIVE